jgi:uncharacterized membrane protein YgcG
MSSSDGVSGLALQLGVPEFLETTVSNIVAFLPRLLAAIVILLIGWIIGRIVARVVRELVDKSGLDGKLMDTPIGRFAGGDRRSVRGIFAKIAAYYIYLLALVAAADALAIAVLSQWVTRAVSYVPAFLAGLLVILLGFVVADFIGDAIERSQTVTDNRYTSVFADGVRFFLYFVVLTIGLDTMGIDTELLYILAEAAAYGLGAALAIGVGIAIGLGAKGYVDENIDRWMGSAKRSARKSADQHSRLPGSRGSTGGSTSPPSQSGTGPTSGSGSDSDSDSGSPGDD